MSHRKTIAQLEQENAKLTARIAQEASVHTHELGELRGTVKKITADLEHVTLGKRDELEALIGERDEARDKLKLAEAVAQKNEQELKRLQGAADEAERLRTRLHLANAHLVGLLAEEDEDLR